MININMTELLKPYADLDENGKPTRTIEGQIHWLGSKGISPDVINMTLTEVYGSMAAGANFATGHLLDRHMLDVALKYQRQKLSTQVAVVQETINRNINKQVEKVKEEYQSDLKRVEENHKKQQEADRKALQDVIEATKAELEDANTRLSKMGYFRKLGKALIGTLR